MQILKMYAIRTARCSLFRQICACVIGYESMVTRFGDTRGCLEHIWRFKGCRTGGEDGRAASQWHCVGEQNERNNRAVHVALAGYSVLLRFELSDVKLACVPVLLHFAASKARVGNFKAPSR
jgi:hypothetical protein